MAKTENILRVMEELKQTTGVPRTLFAACPNSLSVIKASFRAAKRNNAPIYFATTLNQVDTDGGYTGMTPAEFTKVLAREAAAVHYTGPYVVAIDHGYINGLSCSQTSQKLGISLEMVKYYLFKTRKLLKEGIGMEREYGEKSYNPAKFEFVTIFSGEFLKLIIAGLFRK